MDISEKGPGNENQRAAIKQVRRQDILDLYTASVGPRLLGSIAEHQGGLVMLLRETNHQQNMIIYDMILRVNPKRLMIGDATLNMYRILGAHYGTMQVHLDSHGHQISDPNIRKNELPLTPKEKVWPFEQLFVPLYSSYTSRSKRHR